MAGLLGQIVEYSIAGTGLLVHETSSCDIIFLYTLSHMTGPGGGRESAIVHIHGTNTQFASTEISRPHPELLLKGSLAKSLVITSSIRRFLYS